jgi:hypothetical protein
MSIPVPRSRFAPLPVDLAVLVGGAVLLVVVLALSRGLAADVGDTLTRNTVRLSLAWYTAALCLMLRLGPADWTGRTAASRLARDCWTWGLVCFLVHLAMAFHYYHHWSHAHAFEHTREVSGVGQGLYVSYLFTLVWAADVAWWWQRPAQFAARSPWIDRSLHAFMLFIVFNSMVIYEQGPIRWAGLLMFGVLAVAWLAARRRRAGRLPV